MSVEWINPEAIPQMVEVSDRDAERLRQAIARNYGFVPTLEYCRDLIAYTDSMSKRGAQAPQKGNV